MGVAVTHHRGITLLSGVTAAGEVEHTFVRISKTLVLIKTHRVIERVKTAAFCPESIAEHVFVQVPTTLMVVPSVGLFA